MIRTKLGFIVLASFFAVLSLVSTRHSQAGPVDEGDRPLSIIEGDQILPVAENESEESNETYNYREWESSVGPVYRDWDRDWDRYYDRDWRRDADRERRDWDRDHRWRRDWRDWDRDYRHWRDRDIH
jgi:hypothetical protein